MDRSILEAGPGEERALNWESLNWLDFSIVLVLLATACIAFLTGLLRELLSIAALCLGLFVASIYYIDVASFLSRRFGTPEFLALVSFLGLLTFVWSFVGGAGLLFVKFLPRGSAGLGDRILGFLFGMVKGLALATVVLMVLTVYLPAENQAFRESRLYPVVIQGARLFSGLLPGEEREILRVRLKGLGRPTSDPVEGFV